MEKTQSLLRVELLIISSVGRGLYNISTIDTGNGEDIITASGGIQNDGTIDTGDGDDIITGSSGFSDFSDDITGIDNKGTIDTGNGNDSIIADRLDYRYRRHH
jgi:hypothetical protein